MIQDSGNRREFETGAVRDIQEGKGRCDLLPLDVISDWTGDNVFANIGKFIETRNEEYIHNAIDMFVAIAYDNNSNVLAGRMYTAILEVAKHYGEGCKKYGERNWEKGIPLHCYIDSGVRHYLKWQRGDNDERHDRAFVWNMLGALWTLKHKPELDDLPKVEKENEK